MMQVSPYGLITWVPWRIDEGGAKNVTEITPNNRSLTCTRETQGLPLWEGEEKKKQTLRDRKQETDHQEMETVCNGRVVLNVTL